MAMGDGVRAVPPANLVVDGLGLVARERGGRRPAPPNAGIAQRQSRGLPNRRSRVRFPLPAPNIAAFVERNRTPVLQTGRRGFESRRRHQLVFCLAAFSAENQYPFFRKMLPFGGGATGGAADFESA